MTSGRFTFPQKVLLVVPLAVLISMLLVFALFAKLFGTKAGYLAAFIFYWLIWCLIFPLWILGGEGLRHLFRRVTEPLGKPALLGFILLVLPPLLAGTTAFRVNVVRADLAIFLVSLALALVNGTLEEILWRGTYTTAFPNHLLFGYLFPAFGFAVWHLAPQVVHPSSMPGGITAFIFGALFLGLCWGWVAWRTNSILLTVLSHVLTDFLGLGALVYFSR